MSSFFFSCATASSATYHGATRNGKERGTNKEIEELLRHNNGKQLIFQPQTVETELIQNRVLGILRATFNAMNFIIYPMVLVKKAAKVIIAHFQLMNTLAMLRQFVDQVVVFHTSPSWLKRAPPQFRNEIRLAFAKIRAATFSPAFEKKMNLRNFPAVSLFDVLNAIVRNSKKTKL